LVAVKHLAGPRNYIGNHVTMIEAQLVLATLVQRVMFELVSGQQIEPEPLITSGPRMACGWWCGGESAMIRNGLSSSFG
jgi:hypothetical protein